ncbi:hypothetical protein [Rhodoplanes elegans]|uniref:hypothetical protein n=1 Tax=Rhodoplanes elegans TaxID=29408 RepID=UPI0014761708|nr:hypothetical protein [Rhodoplanes elegans]
MPRTELRTFETDAPPAAARTPADSKVERAETGRPTGREARRTTTDRSAVAYCVDNDLI